MGNNHHHNHQHGSNHILLWPLLLITGFAFFEAIGGWLTGSLALLGDAGHMFSDAAALGLAWLGAWIARKPASLQHSFGLIRAEVIVALVNGLLMLLVLVGIVYEAIQRLQAPQQPVQGAEVMLIALIGLIVNIIVARQLHHGLHNINHRAAFLHVLGDLLGSVAALAAGAVIYFTGWMPIDPILSLFICALILFSTIKLLREVLHVLMEGVPSHLDIAAVSQAMSTIPQVYEVHSVHIWGLSSEMTALSAHVVMHDMQAWHEVLEDLRHMLHERFDINHVTLQPESLEGFTSGEAGCWLTKSRHGHLYD
ncbi:MAG: cation diffusion facilitator family transporter [Methylophilaceae bacterium]